MEQLIREDLETVGSCNTRSREKIDAALESFERLMKCFSEAAEEDRKELLARIDGHTAQRLTAIANRCAELALNTSDARWIDNGFLAHLIEGFRTDYRESYRNLVLLDHAARSIDYGLDHTFKKHRNLADAKTIKWVEAFLKRDPTLNHLKAFGLEERRTASGVIIVAV